MTAMLGTLHTAPTLSPAPCSKPSQVRMDDRDGFQVTGLSQHPCGSAAEALDHMRRALQLRHTRSHRLNDYSSRSHCLMTFVFASEDKGEQGAKGGVKRWAGLCREGGRRCEGEAGERSRKIVGERAGLTNSLPHSLSYIHMHTHTHSLSLSVPPSRYGKLVLVDLAGSERLKETGNTDRDAVRETGCINKSLFTLGQVRGKGGRRERAGGREREESKEREGKR